MSLTQDEKAARFRALHDAPGTFLIPNPWDVGSARVLAGLGFQALATSSAAAACALGRRDGGLTRDEALAHGAPDRRGDGLTRLRGPGEWVRRRAGGRGGNDPACGGGGTRRMHDRGCDREPGPSPLRSSAWLIERIAAAAEAARALPFPFILTARAHNLLYAPSSLDDTISRLQAFEKAGASVLFAPGLPDLAAVRAVCAAVSKPVNFMVGIKGKSFSVGELAAAGVKRISLATSLYRAAMTGLLDAVREVKDTGQFAFLDRCVTTPELNKLMRI